MLESEDFTIDAMYRFINAQLQMAHNDSMQRAIVKSSKNYPFGKPLDNSHWNDFLDTIQYEIEFLDRTV